MSGSLRFIGLMRRLQRSIAERGGKLTEQMRQMSQLAISGQQNLGTRFGIWGLKVGTMAERGAGIKFESGFKELYG
jgi:hypothetical protein